eukprot:COSAG01_NODE_4986_length_4569_cov_6.806711_4_plen_168_part_00
MKERVAKSQPRNPPGHYICDNNITDQHEQYLAPMAQQGGGGVDLLHVDEDAGLEPDALERADVLPVRQLILRAAGVVIPCVLLASPHHGPLRHSFDVVQIEDRLQWRKVIISHPCRRRPLHTVAAPASGRGGVYGRSSRSRRPPSAEQPFQPAGATRPSRQQRLRRQ